MRIIVIIIEAYYHLLRNLVNGVNWKTAVVVGEEGGQALAELTQNNEIELYTVVVEFTGADEFWHSKPLELPHAQPCVD